MKAMLERLPKESGQSFVICDFDYPYYPTPWHYHPEYEIVLVTESCGTRYVGDSITTFEPGDLVLVGPDLPHMYRNDEHYYNIESELRAKSIVIHFSEESLGETLKLPEMDRIRKLLQRSKYGLEFTGVANRKIASTLKKIVATTNGFERWLTLMEILQVMATCEESECCAISSSSLLELHETDEERLHGVFSYVGERFKEHISLEQAAELANMTPSAFSRYFKYRTRKTFSSFLLELRIGHAAKLLMQSERRVGEVCYECGFNNLSNFNRHFKTIYNMQPREFKKQIHLLQKRV
jgi:AraC-like DNA-binding protein